MGEWIRPSPEARSFLRRWLILAVTIVPAGFAIDALNSTPYAWRYLLAIVLFAVLPVALVGAFLLFVWPTLWRYERVGETVARIRRFDGTAEVLTPQGWRRVTSR